MTTAPAAKTTAAASKGIGGFLAILSPSPAVAGIVFGWANIGLIASLVVGVISTALIVWMGNIRDADLKARLANSNAIAEGAVRDAAKANAGLARAQADIADANARTAEATLQTERLRTQVSPRFLSSDDAEILISALKKARVSPITVVSFGDMEPIQFADQLALALQKAGLLADRVTSERINGSQGVGVVLPHPVRSEEMGHDSVVMALRAAHIDVTSVGSGNTLYSIPDALGGPTPAFTAKPGSTVVIVSQKRIVNKPAK